jgi:hypothetical protein
MRMTTAVSFMLFCAAASLPAQQQPKLEGARELYYNAMVQKDPPPPVRRAPARASSGSAVPIVPVSMAAMHLGLRYNLVLVDENSGRTQPAASDRIFRAGECFALDIESNRAGFLYVLAKQSSGSWHPLLPSREKDMATESNTIMAGTKVRIPLKHCFAIEDPPGVETLFVVLSREPRDTFDLYEKIKAPADQQRQAPKRPAAPVEIADASIADGAVTRMREQFGTRDIAIIRVSQPLAPAEPAGSVYVVNSSSNPASNLAAQIEVRHR